MASTIDAEKHARTADMVARRHAAGDDDPVVSAALSLGESSDATMARVLRARKYGILDDFTLTAYGVALLELVPPGGAPRSRLQGVCSTHPEPGIWFDETRYDEAKEMCLHCPVFVACGEAGRYEAHGVWGGRDEHERGTTYVIEEPELTLSTTNRASWAPSRNGVLALMDGGWDDAALAERFGTTQASVRRWRTRHWTPEMARTG